MKWTKISAIIGTVLLVSALTLKLVGYGKEIVPEVSEPNCIIIIEAFDPNDVLWDDTVFLEITLTNEPNFADSDRVYLYKGDDFDIVIEKKEPNEPTMHISEFVPFPEEPEPNEPECSHDIIYGISQGYSGGSTVCAICGESIKTYALGDADAVLHYHEPKPEPQKVSLDFIPTWPDYIELNKELVIKDPKEMGSWLVFTKGTKIYFKGDD